MPAIAAAAEEGGEVNPPAGRSPTTTEGVAGTEAQAVGALTTAGPAAAEARFSPEESAVGPCTTVDTPSEREAPGPHTRPPTPPLPRSRWETASEAGEARDVSLPSFASEEEALGPSATPAGPPTIAEGVVGEVIGGPPSGWFANRH